MAAETFLRDYVSYENCLVVNEMMFHIKRYIEPVDLDTLLECSDLLEGFALLRELPSVGWACAGPRASGRPVPDRSCERGKNERSGGSRNRGGCRDESAETDRSRSRGNRQSGLRELSYAIHTDSVDTVRDAPAVLCEFRQVQYFLTFVFFFGQRLQ